MLFLPSLSFHPRLVATTAGLLAAALLTACNGGVIVDPFAAPGAPPDVPTPVVPPATHCDAPPFQRLFGGASSAAMSAPWAEPQIVTDSACNLVVAGTPAADVDFGNGPVAPGGLFVARLDSAGKALWTRRFDATFDALGGSLDGHLVVSGQFDESIDFGGGVKLAADGKGAFLVELDAGGAPVWARPFSAAAYPTKIIVEGSGGVLVSGYLSGTADLGAGPVTSGVNAAFVARYDAAGAPVFSRVFEGAEFIDTALDPAGDVFLTGTFKGTLDLGGGPLTTTSGLANRDLYVARLGPHGEHRWSARFGGPGSNTYLAHLAVDGAGGAYLTGTFGGSLDLGGGQLAPGGSTNPADAVVYDALFVARIDGAGKQVFARSFGHGLLLPLELVSTADGVVVAVDSYQASADFGGGPLAAPAGYGLFLATLDPAGEHIASRDFAAGSPTASVVANLAVDASGKPLLVGTLVGAADFDGGALTGSATGSLFVAKLGQ